MGGILCRSGFFPPSYLQIAVLNFRFVLRQQEESGKEAAAAAAAVAMVLQPKKIIQRGRIGWEGRKEAGKEEKEKKKKKENFLCLVFRLGSVSSCPAKSVTEQPTAEEEEKKKKK